MAEINRFQIISWLEKVLSKKNLKNISVDILGSSEKGSGFMGDIVFVNATGTNTTSNQEQKLNLVLKCSKKSEALRAAKPVKEIFYKEILMYDTILPEFQQFQKSKSIDNVFDNIPKYYGCYTNETTEIIVLENLKANGYELWDSRVPLTKKHLLMVLEKYGVYHAISAALRVQNPEKFNEFCKKLEDLKRQLTEGAALEKMLGAITSEVYGLLKDCCDEEVLEKLNNFKSQILHIYTEMFTECDDDFRVISHGDCWNNNFMWKYNGNDKSSPEKVVILDWQIPSLVSPILDLSYFIFSCVSQAELNDFNTVLDTYYNSFSQTLKQLGNNAEDIYPKEKFLTDWQKYARYGVGMSILINKLSFTKKENLPDVAKSAEQGKKLGETFAFNADTHGGYKERIKPVVEFAAKNHLLD